MMFNDAVHMDWTGRIWAWTWTWATAIHTGAQDGVFCSILDTHVRIQEWGPDEIWVEAEGGGTTERAFYQTNCRLSFKDQSLGADLS